MCTNIFFYTRLLNDCFGYLIEDFYFPLFSLLNKIIHVSANSNEVCENILSDVFIKK